MYQLEVWQYVQGMPRISVRERRTRFDREDDDANGVWICECCGEDWEETLCVYEVMRVTRHSPDSRGVILCVSCADRIPHGRVLCS